MDDVRCPKGMPLAEDVEQSEIPICREKMEGGRSAQAVSVKSFHL